jgi:hypothetical protein
MPCNCPGRSKASRVATRKARKAALSGIKVKPAKPKKATPKRATPKKAKPCKCT